jgi:mRNA-degrading endonuclease RelE of RelBE toxin-antitoxin system
VERGSGVNWKGCSAFALVGMRAVYEVDAEKKVVIVLAIGPRGDIYKK